MAAEIGTTENSSASFKLKGVFLCDCGSDYLYLPAPLDLVAERPKRGHTAAIGRKTVIKKSPPFVSNLDYESCPFSVGIEKAESVNDYYLTHTGFSAYLVCSETEFDIYHKSTFFEIEYKTGIKMNPLTKSVEEGNLYRVGMRRLKKNYALACDLEGVPSLRPEGSLKLGGEGKVVRYERVSLRLSENREAVLERIRETGLLKIYFGTPVLFKNGWIPDEDVTKGPNHRLRLLTASTGNPVCVGGWDMAKGGHKPMLRAVPAGSVYYFGIETGDPERIYDSFHGRNLGLRANEGFGLALVGGV